MALLSELITRIVADNSQFNRETKRSEDRVASLVSRIRKNSDELARLGKRMTTFVTLPIIGLGVATVKAASDMEESINAVNVVFGNSAKIITDWSQNAAEEVGLSAVAINKASTVLGSALQNVGFTADAAAEETIKLTRRAADMASVFNTDVNQALQAIQALLRGEIDPIERFGVTANEAAIKSRAMADGIHEGTGELTAQEKVLARIAVLYEQTDRVEGDFVRTSDSLANSTRITAAQVTNMAAKLGTDLLPIAAELVGELRKLVARFSELSPTLQSNLIKVAALAAAAGPLLFTVGRLPALVNGLASAFTALSGPVGLVAIGLGAVAVAVVSLISQQRRLAEEDRLLDEAMTGTLTTTEEYDEAIRILYGRLEEQRAAEARLGRELDLTREKAYDGIAAQAGWTAEYRQAVETGDRYNDQLNKIARNQQALNRITADTTKKRKEEQAAALAALEAEAAAAAEAERQALAAAQARARAAQQAQQDFDREQAHHDAIIGIVDRRIAREQATRQAFEDWKQQKRDEEEAAIQAMNDRVAALVSGTLTRTAQLVSAFGDFFGALADAQFEESTRGIREELDGLEALGELTEAQAERKMDLQKQLDDAQKKFAHDEAARQKLFSIFTIGLKTAEAIVSALTVDPTGILAALNAAIGAAQLAAVIAQPLPALQAGGVHTGPAVVGEGGGPELALPLTDYRALSQITDAFQRAMDQQADSRGSAGEGAFSGDVILDGQMVGKVLGRMSRNGQLLVSQRAVVR